MTDLELRLHCLVLAVQHLERMREGSTALTAAEEFYAFLAPATAGQGVQHNAANLHPTHPTIQ